MKNDIKRKVPAKTKKARSLIRGITSMNRSIDPWGDGGFERTFR
jgi:hypothetical protein